MARIFLSYRRADTADSAGRLYDTLTAQFGAGAVFHDVDELRAGQDFAAEIDARVARSTTLIALIGPRWLAGRRDGWVPRVHEPTDVVRLEIAAALRRNIRVIPVLVQGGSMPSAQSLPEDIKALARLHAVELRHSAWRSDVARLLSELGLPDVAQGGYRIGRTQLPLAVAIVAAGWACSEAFSWSAGASLLGGLDADSAGTARAVIRALAGALGGVVTALVLRWALPVLHRREVLLITLAWAISGVAGNVVDQAMGGLAFLDALVNGALGGLATGALIRTVRPSVPWRSVLVICGGWALAGALGSVVVFAAALTFYSAYGSAGLVVIAAIAWAVFGSVGALVTFRELQT